jgi:hypothetical protein
MQIPKLLFAVPLIVASLTLSAAAKPGNVNNGRGPCLWPVDVDSRPRRWSGHHRPRSNSRVPVLVLSALSPG